MNRILFVHLEGMIGGAEASLLLLVKYLHRRFLINIACLCKSPLSKSMSSIPVTCYQLPSSPRCSYFSFSFVKYWLRASYHLIKIVVRTQPDIIHANSFYAALISVLIAFIMRKKLFIHARDLTNFGFLAKLFSWSCTKVVASSHSVEKKLIEQGVSPEKIEVVYNGVDNDLINQSRINRTSSNSINHHKQDSFVFAHIAQFAPWKNHIIFLKAALDVANNLPNARFVLIGDDIFGRNLKYKNSLISYARNSAIAERISFLGWQQNMNEVWPKIDCLVHTAEREPFGRVIIEAMANKIPVIAVNSCGPSEIIQNGKTGILVQAGDIVSLSNAMLKIFQDAYLASRLANAGYKHVVSNFTADKTALLIQEIYKKVLAA